MPFQTNATIGAYGGGASGSEEEERSFDPTFKHLPRFMGPQVHHKNGAGRGHANSISAAAAPAASASSFFTVQTSYMVIAKVIVPIVSCFLCVVTLIFQQLDSFRFSAKKTAKSISRNRINNHCSLHSAANVQPHTDREACNYYVTCDALS